MILSSLTDVARYILLLTDFRSTGSTSSLFSNSSRPRNSPYKTLPGLLYSYLLQFPKFDWQKTR